VVARAATEMISTPTAVRLLAIFAHRIALRLDSLLNRSGGSLPIGTPTLQQSQPPAAKLLDVSMFRMFLGKQQPRP
jgi:hypothetical protein